MSGCRRTMAPKPEREEEGLSGGDPQDPAISLRTAASSKRRQVGRDCRRREPSLAVHRGAPGSNGLVHTTLQGPPATAPQAACPRQTRCEQRGISSLHRKTAQPPGLAWRGGRGCEDGSRREKAPSPAPLRLGSQALRPHSPPQAPNRGAARQRGAERPSPVKTQKWGRKERREEGSPSSPAPHLLGVLRAAQTRRGPRPAMARPWRARSAYRAARVPVRWTCGRCLAGL